MKHIQIILLLILYFIPPTLAQRGKNKLITFGSLTVITLLASMATYGRFGLTQRFGWAILGLFICTGLVAIFTIEFSNTKRKDA